MAWQIQRQLHYLIEVTCAIAIFLDVELLLVPLFQVCFDRPRGYCQDKDESGFGEDELDAFKQPQRVVGETTIQIVEKDNNLRFFPPSGKAAAIAEKFSKAS
jgi:hypothetical protein